MTEKQLKQVAELSAKGWTAQEVADEMGYTKSYIEKAKWQNGIKGLPRGRKSSFTEEEQRQMRVMYAKGMRITDIGRAFGTSYNTVVRYIR